MRTRSLPVLFSTLVLAALGQAQEASPSGSFLLDQIIVTAGRDGGSIATAAESVQVVTSGEIEDFRSTTSSAADLVARLVPGYSVDTQSISGASENFRGRNVLIMVDGVPRNTPLRDISRILSLIDLNTVERIEVVNGASSLYGAQATGGIINFITKRGETEKPTVTLRTGVTAFTADIAESITPEVGVTVSGRQEAFDYFFSASGDLTRRFYDGGGDEMASDAMLGQGGGDRTKSGNLFGALGYDIDASRRIETSFDWTYARQEPDYFTNYTTSPVSPDFTDPYVGDPLEEDSKYLTGKYSDEAFMLGALEIKGFYNSIYKRSPFTELSAVNPIVYYSGNPASPTASFNQSALDAQRAGVNLTINTPFDQPLPGASITWGADYTYDYTTQILSNDADAIAPMGQHNVALFGQLEVPLTDRFRVQGGARFDQFFLTVEDFTRPTAYALPGVAYPAVNVEGGEFDYNALTFNAGGVFDVTQEAQLFGNFSQGYSLTDIGAFTRRAGVNSRGEMCDAYGFLSGVPGCGTAPDFALSYSDIAPEPQLVNTYEAGIRGGWDNGFRGSLSAFISTSEEGLTYDIAANRVSQQEERIWGVEATAEYDVSDMFTVGGVIGYLEGRYDADGDGEIEDDEWLPNNRISSTVNGLAYLTARFDHGITARGEVEFFSGRARIGAQELDPAALLNASVSKTFANQSELSIGVRNLLDTDYVNPTASATRGADVPGLGRTIFASYTVTF